MELLKIDHVTIAGPDLAQLTAQLTRLGLAPVYGGPHSNGITHMSMLGFDDGSYLELISKLAAEAHSPLWDGAISNAAGSCAWAIEVDDVSAEAARVAALGITVRGPNYMNRKRPDGALVEWDLAFLGNHEPGAKLPFIIKDRTPRALRVTPTESVSNTELRGISNIILAVEDLAAASQLFQKLYPGGEAAIAHSAQLQARLAIFNNSPIILAEPFDDSNLKARLIKFGELPCGFLIATNDIAVTKKRFSLTQCEHWAAREICWLPADALINTAAGFINIL